MNTRQQEFLESSARLADVQQQLAFWKQKLNELENTERGLKQFLQQCRPHATEQATGEAMLARAPDPRGEAATEGAATREVEQDAWRRQLVAQLEEAQTRVSAVKQALNAQQALVSKLSTNMESAGDPQCVRERLIAENELARLMAQFQSSEMQLIQIRALVQAQEDLAARAAG